MKVLVTGASGFVGRRVVSQLLHKKHEVFVLTRNLAKAAVVLGADCKYVQWLDMNSPAPVEAFDGVDAVINLMGENIGEKNGTRVRRKRFTIPALREPACSLKE